MNYGYDYRSYFQEITGDLDSLISGQEDLVTEVRQLHSDFSDELDQVDETLSEGFTLLSALLVVICAVGVFFK